ncbi:hypothetical protein AAFF_G00438060 [Aldrovandia affinis]|uniref:Uncharacterized protein n=1 Tax=Aldrovandia affinis TaxID=143900 RepID=A0AAD7WI58_9TELE|nr:hypothetical protein AAFF_G00438060 [Aldrovandia affinis]
MCAAEGYCLERLYTWAQSGPDFCWRNCAFLEFSVVKSPYAELAHTLSWPILQEHSCVSEGDESFTCPVEEHLNRPCHTGVFFVGSADWLSCGTFTPGPAGNQSTTRAPDNPDPDWLVSSETPPLPALPGPQPEQQSAPRTIRTSCTGG